MVPAGVGAVVLEQTGSTTFPSAGNARVFPAEKVAAFRGVLDEARMHVQPAQFVVPAPTADPLRVNPTTTVSDVESRRETIKALELEPSAVVKPATEGDAILSGLKKLQGEFNGKQEALVRDMAVTGTSSASLLKLQMDMVQYTLMIDVASKITGKMTQAIDSLTKGQ